VPEDICLIGFDNIPESSYLTPSLTTVKQDFNSVGKMAMSKVLSQLKESVSRETIMIEPELLIKESTGPLQKKLGRKNVS
jgi:DNA-binding LacI/PurR family transcriptional regulator